MKNWVGWEVLIFPSVLMNRTVLNETFNTLNLNSQNEQKIKLEDLTVLKRSPDLLDNVKIGRDQLWIIMKHILIYGGCGHFGQVT